MRGKMNKRVESNSFIKDKRGIAIAMIVTIILVIIGFVILLYFYSSLDLTSNIDKEVCHQSVVYRASLPEFAGVKEYVPLKCRTTKICITPGGSCDEFRGISGVVNAKVRDQEDVEQIIAKEIIDCWLTMGEGKLSLFNDWLARTYGFGTVSSSCVICSRIAFDEEGLEKEGIDLNKIDVLNYMITHKMPGKDTSYYIYLTGNRGKMSLRDNRIDNVKIEFPETLESETGENQEEVSLFFEEMGEGTKEKAEELSVMFMQVYSPDYWDVFQNDLITLLGGSIGGFVLGGKYAGKAMTAAVKSPGIWVLLAVVGIYQYNSISNNQAVTAGYCGDISVSGEAKKGCSVVRTVNYNEDDLSKYCSIIESIP